MRVNVPDLDDLYLLVTIARTGSIGQASAELRVAQPSASRRIAALERNLKVGLLRRGARGSTLTPAGRVVVDWAITLLRAAEDFRHSVDALSRQRNSSLRAAASMTIAEHYASNWLAMLRYESPDTAVSLSVGNSLEVMELVESGKVEVGLIETPNVHSNLRHRQIGTDRLAVAVAPGHPWAEALVVSAADLAATPLLVREPGSGTRDTLDRAMSEAGHEIKVSLELASNTALKSAAIAGMGPVILAGIALADDFATGSLVQVAVSDIVLSRPLTIVWTDNTSLSQEAVGLFLGAIRNDRRKGRLA
ncbi:LysR family transcriptional regulator [Paenarthrobacter aromaticivorans]|uniref:LysR family transcriptional regulator n=1 Tax=Paenarthrobacter aromaticivorans TaxID=2849150 RepID=UPI003A7F88A0